MFIDRFFNRNKKNKTQEIESQAAKYLDRLQENYHALFSAPLQKSVLAKKDIEIIEKELGYQLPRPYVDFLLSCSLPECLTVSASFCGDYASCYEPEQEEALFVTLKMEWYTALCGGVKEFLSSVRKEDMPLGGEEDSFLDAGFLKIAEFEGYFVFLDLVTGKVVHIYHEAVYDMSIVDGVDVTNYQEVRDYLSAYTLCENFYDFLRLACTRDIYDEDSLTFKTVDEIKKEQAEYKEPSIEEDNEVKEKAIAQVMARENLSRDEAIQFLADLVQITVEEFNKGMK